MEIFAMTKMTICRPDDWHLHLRDGSMLRAVIDETARHFARAIIMPNLVPPVVTGADAAAYRDRPPQALARAERVGKTARDAREGARARSVRILEPPRRARRRRRDGG